MSAAIAEANRTLAQAAQVKRFAIVEDVWDAASGFVTPTMKVKRNVVENAYGKLLDSWYAQKKPVVWQNL
jgi:long-subunit acyl-CoA synthetase (AMP-forming)